MPWLLTDLDECLSVVHGVEEGHHPDLEAGVHHGVGQVHGERGGVIVLGQHGGGTHLQRVGTKIRIDLARGQEIDRDSEIDSINAFIVIVYLPSQVHFGNGDWLPSGKINGEDTRTVVARCRYDLICFSLTLPMAKMTRLGTELGSTHMLKCQ